MLQELSYSPDRVSVVWEDGQTCDYHSLWLLDNNPANRDPANGQRLIDVADLPAESHITSAVHTAGTLQVFWSDGSAASFPVHWLSAHRTDSFRASSVATQMWPAYDADILRRFSYPETRESASYRREWLRTIATRGIAFLNGVPPQEGQVLDIAALVGWVRETNYGRVFDVRAVSNPNNLAYTPLALGLHTDNPYRDPVPGLQILHCLRAGAGGESLFADGFAVADALRSGDLAAFEILACTPVRFEFCDAKSHLSAERALIELDRDSAPMAIHYNSRSMAPLEMPANRVGEFYRAYRSFALLLRDQHFVLNTSLGEGEAVVFDNRRVLHGRTAFTADVPRHLQGCYLDRDGLFSNLLVLEKSGRANS
jgi:gamma-butyrobetaine hydroxylase